MIFEIHTDVDGFIVSWSQPKADEEGNKPVENGVTYFDRSSQLFHTIANGEVDHNDRPVLDTDNLYDTYHRPKWKIVAGDAVDSTRTLEARQRQIETRMRLRAAYAVEAELSLLRTGIADQADPEYVAYKAAADKIASDVAAL